VLTRQPTRNTLGTISCATTRDLEAVLAAPELDQLRLGNPATRALPLLRNLARREAGRVVLPMNRDTNLAVELRTP